MSLERRSAVIFLSSVVLCVGVSACTVGEGSTSTTINIGGQEPKPNTPTPTRVVPTETPIPIPTRTEIPSPTQTISIAQIPVIPSGVEVTFFKNRMIGDHFTVHRTKSYDLEVNVDDKLNNSLHYLTFLRQTFDVALGAIRSFPYCKSAVYAKSNDAVDNASSFAGVRKVQSDPSCLKAELQPQ